MFLTQPACLGENANVRAGRALVLMALLAVQPLCVFAASYASKRDPVGEKVYASGTPGRMAPIAIIAGGFTVAWLLARARRNRKEHTAGSPGSQQG